MSCCAMAQISIQDNEPLANIKAFIRKATRERNEIWNPLDRQSGETMLIVTVSPWEDNLRTNLLSLGFEFTKSLPRRKGYPKVGVIEMYTLILPLHEETT